jgi:hypothetical protein
MSTVTAMVAMPEVATVAGVGVAAVATILASAYDVERKNMLEKSTYRSTERLRENAFTIPS